jgi:hypothetical protein
MARDANFDRWEGEIIVVSKTIGEEMVQIII